MNSQQILEELLALLEAGGVAVRSEPLGGGAGLCTVKGRTMFFVDTQADCSEMTVICAEAVRKVLDIEKIYIRPQLRQFIENHTRIEKQ